MFKVSLGVAFMAIVHIFLMGLVGFLLVRKGVIKEEGLKLLSFLSVNVVFPMFIFYQILTNFNPSQMPFWWGYPLINICLCLTGLLLVWAIFRFNHRKLKEEYMASAGLHNAGYIPLLIGMALPLGDMAAKVYPAIILSIIGFDLCLWSLGVWLVARHQKGRMDLKQMLNPPLLAMAAAIGLVLSNNAHAIPMSFLKPVKMMGDAAMAMAMLVIGGNLALTSLKRVNFYDLSGVVLVKLVAMPLIVLCFLFIVPLDPLMKLVCMIQACMPTAVSLSIIGRHYNTANQDFINQAIFFTHLVAMWTLPVFLALFGKLF